MRNRAKKNLYKIVVSNSFGHLFLQNVNNSNLSCHSNPPCKRTAERNSQQAFAILCVSIDSDRLGSSPGVNVCGIHCREGAGMFRTPFCSKKSSAPTLFSSFLLIIRTPPIPIIFANSAQCRTVSVVEGAVIVITKIIINVKCTDGLQ